MKKVLVTIIVLIILLLAGVYLYIPRTLTVANVATLHCTAAGANRTLLKKENWRKLWIGEKMLTPDPALTTNDLFLYNNDTFCITQLLQNGAAIAISNGAMHVTSRLMTLPVHEDSIALNWTYSDTTSLNPFTRIQQYRQAVATKKNMEAVLQSMKQFLSRSESIYGISIEQTSTHDTTLVSTYSISNAYPATNDIYNLVKKLQAYIDKNGAQQTGNPMLNITPLPMQQYKIMVAVPTNKILNEQAGNIAYKRMIPGNFLATTVTGGNATVNDAYKQMLQYIQDYQRTPMAIPFEVLITDRTRQTDTSKWVTKLYFPVI